MNESDGTQVRVGGMRCGGCVRAVTRALEQAGFQVREVEVGRASLRGAPAVDAIRTALEGAGFEVLGIEPS